MTNTNNKAHICERCGKEYTAKYNFEHFCENCKEIINNEITEFIEQQELERQKEAEIQEKHNKITPKSIKKYLDEYVVGQDEAKKNLSVAAYTHLKRLKLKKANPGLRLDKSNVLLLGPSGCGKTHLIRTLAQMLDIPYCIADATSLTESGYVGEDVESVLQKLLAAANGNLEKAEQGIIFIDEIDKKCRKEGENISITRDVSGEGVQQALLKLVEGEYATVQLSPGRRNPAMPAIQMNTENILFVFSGAFNGIEKIIKKRLEPKNNIINILTESKRNDSVTLTDYNNIIEQITHEDIIKYGIIPELAGRIPVISAVNQLDCLELRRILTEPKDSIVSQYKTIFKDEGVDLEISDAVLDGIAYEAISEKTGARSLREKIEKLLNDYIYNIDELPSRLVIDVSEKSNIA